MKRCLLAGTLAFALVFALWKAGEAHPVDLAQHVKTGDLVRLHVIANSDSETDQSDKLKVRDAVLDVARRTLDAAEDKSGALALLNENTGELKAAAQACLKSLGRKDESVRVSIGKYDFPERVYDGVMVPAGEYDAVRVILGEGRGKNWWCVMYPSLCFESESASLATPPKVKFESSIGKWIGARLKKK